MVKHLVVCMVALWVSASARADDVQCERSQEACDAAVLALCPAGAKVLSEEVVSSDDAPVIRYGVGFRCLGDNAGTAASTPAIVPPQNATDVPPVAVPRTAGEELDARYAALEVERRRTSYVGPISLTAVGFSLSGYLVGIGFDVKSDAQADGEGPDDEVAASLWVMSALSLGVGVGGAFWLAKRVKKRTAVDRELREIESQRLTLTYGIDPASRRLWLGGRF
jgi:hypothetical protein